MLHVVTLGSESTIIPKLKKLNINNAGQDHVCFETQSEPQG